MERGISRSHLVKEEVFKKKKKKREIGWELEPLPESLYLDRRFLEQQNTKKL